MELNPTIASVAMAAFEEDPTAMAKAIKVAECIVMVGKKQFDMTSGGDQESNSASSLTAAITNVKLEPLHESTIHKDDSGLPDDPEDIADTVTPTCGTTTDKVANTINAIRCQCLQLRQSWILRLLCPGALMWWSILIMWTTCSPFCVC